jgi:hypothetical protein
MSKSIITDDHGSTIGYWPVVLQSGQDSQSIVVRVVVGDEAGTLRASISTDAILLYRTAGSADPFVELSEGLDLSPFVGTTLRYEIKARASAVVGHAHAMIFVGVNSSSPAAWTA